MNQDESWHGSRPRRRPHCVRWEPSSPERGTAAFSPLFGPCLLWPDGRPSQLLLSICLVAAFTLCMHARAVYAAAILSVRRTAAARRNSQLSLYSAT